MKYIDNAELREWVKDSLKMTIFQKAHALAVQTGCQILVKLQDDADVNQQQQYYATSRLKKVYRQNGLREQPGEKCVSGVTGLPLVEQGIQSEQVHEQTETSSVHSDQAQRSTPENGVKSQESGPDERLDSSDLTAGPVPMQLSLSSDSFPLEDSEEGSGQTDMKPDKGSLDTIDNVADPVRIKVERVDDDDPGGGGGNNTRDTASYEEQMNFDTSIQTPMSAVTPHKATQQLLQASSLFQQEQQSISTTIPPSPATIVQHQQQVPMSPKPYQCAMCGKAFRSVQVLQKHTQTFHMRAQHNVVAVGARNRGNRGRGRQTWQRLTQQTTNPSQTHSFQCVMCNITFPEAEILQEHMTRTHMGGVTPVPQESPANPDFTTQGDPTVAFPGDPVLFGPGTSHQTTSSFPIPHTQSSPNDAPIGLQGTPYSQPSSSAPYSRSVPSTSTKAASSDSASFPRMLIDSQRSLINFHQGFLPSNLLRQMTTTEGGTPKKRRGPKRTLLGSLLYLMPPGGAMPKTSRKLEDEITISHLQEGYGYPKSSIKDDKLFKTSIPLSLTSQEFKQFTRDVFPVIGQRNVSYWKRGTSQLQGLEQFATPTTPVTIRENCYSGIIFIRIEDPE